MSPDPPGKRHAATEGKELDEPPPDEAGPARRRYNPRGPYSPPSPSQVDLTEHEPMAVARDKQTIHEAFLPTTAPHDQLDPEVAERFRQVPAGKGSIRARPKRFGPSDLAANREEEAPLGYSAVDERGYRHLEDLEEEA